jgi:radical SAM superfamily enzyme YgiQ (UPF0313 family)
VVGNLKKLRILIANLKPSSNSYHKRALGQRSSTLHFPIGLGIIAAVLKEKGWNFTVCDTYVDGITEVFLRRVEKGQQDAVLLSGFLGNYSYSFYIDITKKIKELSRNTLVIMGGPMATTMPELLVLNAPIDFVVKGEGEFTIVELLDIVEKTIQSNPIRFNSTLNIKLLNSGVKGIYLKAEGKVIFTGERERIRNLDAVPFPLYNVFPIERYISYLRTTGRCWEICASRGCYGQCKFCKLTFGKRITSYSPELVVKHMLYVKETYGIENFNFVDDNFLSSLGRVKEFVFLLKNKYSEKFRWRFQGRADRIFPEMVENMVEVGLFDISCGIESGSQDMLNRYGKDLNIKKALLNLKTIKNLVDIHCTFIVGGPGETWDTIKKTERFIRQLRLNNANIGILTLFPGTVLYDEAIKDGLIRNEHKYAMNLGPVYDWPYVNISNMSDGDLLRARAMLTETAEEFGDYK